MYDLTTTKRLNCEHMDVVQYPRLHSVEPRLHSAVAAGIVSIEEGMPVSRVLKIIEELKPRDMPELRRVVRRIKYFTGQMGE